MSPDTRTTASSESEPAAQPAIETGEYHSPRRRLLLVGGIVAVLLVLGALSVASFMLLQRSAAPSPAGPAGELPQAGEGEPFESPDSAEENIPTDAEATPTPVVDFSGALLPKDQIRLAVTVGYTRGDTFALTINDVARTYEAPTVTLYEPQAGEPYSMIRLRSATDTIIHEAQFTIGTQAIAENFSIPAAENIPYAVEESTAYIVLPVDAANPPARVEIVTSAGQVLAERDIAFDAIPLRQPAVEDIQDLSRSEGGVLAARAGQLIEKLFYVSTAHAFTEETTIFQLPLVTALPHASLRLAQADSPAPTTLPQLPTPEIEPPDGSLFVKGSQNVRIEVGQGTPTGFRVHYTTDGSDPTQDSPSQTASSFQIQINQITTVKARVYKEGYAPSEIATATIYLKLPTPHINPPDGSQFSSAPVTVTITKGGVITIPDVKFYYTTDGSDPTEDSILYDGSFTISETTTIKARAYKDGFIESDIRIARIEICNPCFYIAVIGDQGAPISSTVTQVRRMVDTIQPWSDYNDKIMVVPVDDEVDVGCRLTPAQGVEGAGGTIVICPYEDRVHQALSGVKWHAAVVVYGHPCNCGSVVRLGNHITGVGTNADDYTLGHQLAHAVGKLVDEYSYQFGYSGAGTGPNCFVSAAKCQEKQQAFPDLQCQSGCRAVEQFRPYSLMMHTFGSRQMGAFDACLLETEIAKDLELPQPPNCENPDLPEDEEPPEGQGTNYWGWRR